MTDSVSAKKPSFFGFLAQNPSLVFTIGIMLFSLAALYGLALIGYSGLSYRIAKHLPFVLLLSAMVYLYITMEVMPFAVVFLMFMGWPPVTDRYEFPLQAETPVTVKDVDIDGGFLGLNKNYRIETTDGVFMAAGDNFHQDQALVVKRYASADGFAELTKLCSKSACAAVEALIPE